MSELRGYDIPDKQGNPFWDEGYETAKAEENLRRTFEKTGDARRYLDGWNQGRLEMALSQMGSQFFFSSCTIGDRPISRPGQRDVPVDAINPSHYRDGKIEVWDFIVDKKLDYCLGAAVKYISRAGKKGGPEKELEDLKKAVNYLERKIRDVEEKDNDQGKEEPMEAVETTLPYTVWFILDEGEYAITLDWDLLRSLVEDANTDKDGRKVNEIIVYIPNGEGRSLALHLNPSDLDGRKGKHTFAKSNIVNAIIDVEAREEKPTLANVLLQMSAHG